MRIRIIMADFIFSLNATLPIFLIMVLGWFLMRIGLFNKEFNKVADKYVFKVALPVLLFKDIATADIRSDFNLSFILHDNDDHNVSCDMGTQLYFYKG